MRRKRTLGRIAATFSMTTILALLVASAPAQASVRFNGPYNITKVSAYYTYEYVYVYAYDYYDCYYDWGGYWNGYQCQVLGYVYHPAYISSASSVSMKQGDLIHFAPTSSPGPAAKIQLTAFPNHPSIIHTAICNSASSGRCTQIWENTAISDFQELTENKCDPASSYDFMQIPPGIRYANPLADSYGSMKFFRPTSSTLVSNFNARKASKIGLKYQLSGYSTYKSYSMCSESASDVMSLNADEGTAQVDLPYSKVSYVLSVGHDEVYRVCRDNISGWARFCFGQGGRDGICNKLANEVLNAFMNEPWRGDGSPVARRVHGMTAPADQHCHIAGTCPSTTTTTTTTTSSGGGSTYYYSGYGY